MQQQLEQNSANGGSNKAIAAAISPPAFTSPDGQIQYLPDDSTFLNLYSDFSPISRATLLPTVPRSASLPLHLSAPSNRDISISSTDHCFYLSRLILQYREMEDRYELCLSNLRQTMEEVESLRHEIFRLRKANTDLAKQLNPNVVKQQNTNTVSFPTPLSIMNDLRRLNFDDSSVESSPTSVLCNGGVPLAQRVSLLKSISASSNEIVKINSSISGRCITSPALLGSATSITAAKSGRTGKGKGRGAGAGTGTGRVQSVWKGNVQNRALQQVRKPGLAVTATTASLPAQGIADLDG